MALFQEILRSVALRELQEETGIGNADLVSTEIFSLELLTVNGHIRNGIYVPSHLHMNVTYLAETDENETLIVNKEENQAVKWWSFEDALKVPKEPWFVEWKNNIIFRNLSIDDFSENLSLCSGQHKHWYISCSQRRFAA